MTAKEYLSQAYWLDKHIDNKLTMIMSLREIATKTTGVMREEVVSHTRNVHSMQDVITKLVDLENDINADIDRLIDIKREIADTVERVEKPECRVVLEYRYLQYHSWEEIADLMSLHIRSVYRLHRQGLKAVDVILIEKSKVVSDCQ